MAMVEEGGRLDRKHSAISVAVVLPPERVKSRTLETTTFAHSDGLRRMLLSFVRKTLPQSPPAILHLALLCRKWSGQNSST
jgi:hypothetical protein